MEYSSVNSYYDSWESRLGYRLLLGGTRHFGYYEPNTWWPFPLTGAMRAMEQRLYELLDLPKGARVLDAGCGAAHVAIFMARRGLKVQGIDLMDRHLLRARKEVAAQGLSNAITLTKMNYQDLSFEDKSYDAIYTVETLSHATDFRQAIAEFHRVLKPGGRLVLLEYEHDTHKNQLARQAVTYVNKLASMPAFEEWTSGFLKKYLEQSGFGEVRHQDFSDNVAPMMRLFFILAIVPYLIIRLLGIRSLFPNATAAVQLYRYSDHIQYVAVSARKPKR